MSASPGLIPVVDLGMLGGVASMAQAINERGQVVGSSDTTVGDTHPFLWRQGEMIDLGVLAGHTARAVDINNRGQVVGTSDTASGFQHAFLWQHGTMTDLGTLGGPVSSATGINDRGQITGVSLTAVNQFHAFRWERGVMTDLGPFDAWKINGRGQIVGSAGHAVLWRNGTLTDLGNVTNHGNGLNEHGDAIGTAMFASGIEHGFLWRRGRLTDLGTLGGSHSIAYGINNRTQIVGTSTPTGQNDDRPFLWQAGSMSDLTQQGLPPDALVVAINDSSRIVGSSGGRAALFDPPAGPRCSPHHGIWSRRVRHVQRADHLARFVARRAPAVGPASNRLADQEGQSSGNTARVSCIGWHSLAQQEPHAVGGGDVALRIG